MTAAQQGRILHGNTSNLLPRWNHNANNKLNDER